MGGLRLLRSIALTALLAGAGGSVGLMLHAGRRNNSHILLILFAIWVLSPFVGLAIADRAAHRWTAPTRTAFYSVILLIALGSLAIYAIVALGPPRAKTAFAFVVVPPASWLLGGLAISIAAIVSARHPRV